MAEFTDQKILKTNDGAELTLDIWMREADQVILSPGDSHFIGSCPEHGQLADGYIWMLVTFTLADHAEAEHGGLADERELMYAGPAIDL